MEETNLNCVAERKKEFLNYLSNVLKDTEKPNSRNCNKTEKHKQEEKQIQTSDVVKIKVFDAIKRKTKAFQISKEISIALMGSIRNSKSLSDLNFECEWSVFRWIQQWLLHQDQVDLPANLLQGVIDAACMLDAPLLLTACLQFWRRNVRYVMKDGEWELLNENVITQFANLFNNCSLEELSDPALQEILYQRFIIFLTEPEPRAQIGHFETISSLWRCKFCGKLVNEKTKSSECQFVAVNPKGDVGWAHSFDPDWSLSGLLTKLQGERKQWRLVYWTLWSYCHFLFCTECLHWFPICEANRCSYHPKKSHTPANAQSGLFLCCGQPNYRFETVQKKTGCQFKAHAPVLKSRKEQEIFKIYHLLNNSNIWKDASKAIETISLMLTHTSPARIHLVNEKYLPIFGKEHKKKKIRKEGWLRHHTTAWNQDNQREQEERAIKGIQKFLSGKDEHKPSPQFHGGSYVNVEAEWWSNLQSKMRNITQEK